VVGELACRSLRTDASLGSELGPAPRLRRAAVATVSLWGSLTICGVLSAALLLGEQISAPTLAGGRACSCSVSAVSTGHGGWYGSGA